MANRVEFLRMQHKAVRAAHADRQFRSHWPNTQGFFDQDDNARPRRINRGTMDLRTAVSHVQRRATHFNDTVRGLRAMGYGDLVELPLMRLLGAYLPKGYIDVPAQEVTEDEIWIALQDAERELEEQAVEMANPRERCEDRLRRHLQRLAQMEATLTTMGETDIEAQELDLEETELETSLLQTLIEQSLWYGQWGREETQTPGVVVDGFLDGLGDRCVRYMQRKEQLDETLRTIDDRCTEILG